VDTAKKLAPIWENLATIFKNDPSVVIANVDADKHKEISTQFGVTGFPTLKFFPKNSKEGKPYNGGRELNDLLKYVNEETGSKRTATGRLEDSVGRTPALDEIAKQFVASDKRSDLIKSAENNIASLTGNDAEWAKYYIIYMNAISKKGDKFITDEKDRLTKMLDGGNLASSKLDEFVIRKNILSQF